MDVAHVHWHNPVNSKSKVFAYYQCQCGSRKSGLRTTSRIVSIPDTEWLAGADREPR